MNISFGERRCTILDIPRNCNSTLDATLEPRIQYAGPEIQWDVEGQLTIRHTNRKRPATKRTAVCDWRSTYQEVKPFEGPQTSAAEAYFY
jgi:hypothetical protein